MPATVQFPSDPTENKLIEKIASRACRLFAEQTGGKPDKLNVIMDIAATHANGNPLRLSALLDADDFNFAHDIGGISRHLNRETGKLENHFRPRFSMPEQA